MKKLLSIISIFALVFTLAACDTGNEDTTPECTADQTLVGDECVDNTPTCADDEMLVGESCVNSIAHYTGILTTIKDDFNLEGNLAEIASDINLAIASGDADITWASSNEAVVGTDGTIARSLTEDVQVTLTATFTLEGVTLTKEFVVTVLKDKQAPTITVTDSNNEIFANIDDANSISGFSASDANDGDLTASVTIVGEYDLTVTGDYSVQLTVTDTDGETATKDVTLIVRYEDPIVVTGETWNVDPTEVQSLVVFDIISGFNDGDAFDILLEGVADGTIDGPTIFFNNSNETKTITVNNGYSVGAILDANGVVIEGRDGANGRLVDATCGVRALCSQGSLNAAEALHNLEIPAGGFAIIAPNLNSDYNTDGRKFINEQIINRLEKVVPLHMDDELFYTYADQAPYLLIDNNFKPTGSFTLTATAGVELNLFEGMMIYDDEGTFGTLTDITSTATISVVIYDMFGNNVAVADPAAFTFETSGSYDLEITISDGTNERVIETVSTVIVFEELTAPAFRITYGENVYIDLMNVPYTYNNVDADGNIDTATYHIYDDYSTLVDANTSAPYLMGWASWFIFDGETGLIEANYNVFNTQLFVAEGVTYIDNTLVADNAALASITDIPAGKILVVAPQQTDYRAFSLVDTSLDLEGATVEFINVSEVPSVVPTFYVPTLVIEETPIDISGYAYNKDIPGTDNMPTGQVLVVTDYNKILGLDGTPLNMGYGSFIVVDDATKTVEVYGNWANVFKAEGVTYADGTGWAAGNVLDALTELPAGKTLYVAPQGTSLRDDLHNVVGTNTDFSGNEIGIYEVYTASTIVIKTADSKLTIAIGDYRIDPSIPGTDNMPQNETLFVTDYNDIIGLDGTPLNMGWGSFIVVDNATGELVVVGNWTDVWASEGITFADGTGYAAANVADALTDLPAGYTLIVGHQGTDLRAQVGYLTDDITGAMVYWVFVE